MPVTITTTLTDNVGPDVAKPGDTLHYEATITNSGDTAATGVQYTEAHTGVTPIDATITITPIAFDDAGAGYTLVGNTPMSFSGGLSVLTNDVDPDGAEANLVAVNATNLVGGTVVLNADGSFTFTPAAGFEGTASFDYTVRDEQTLDSVTTGHVTLTVTDPVWYVDSAATGGGDGTFANPFKTIAELKAGGAFDGTNDTNDTIFFVERGSTYTNATGLTLADGQQLLGDSSGLTSVNGHLVGASNSDSSIDITGVNATAVTLGQNNTINGLNITASGTGGDAIADGGGTVGTLTMTNVDLTAVDQGLVVNGGGTVNITGSNNTIATTSGTILDLTGVTVGASNVAFSALSSTGTVTGTAIILNNVDGGTFSGGAVTIAGTSAGDGIAISGGSAATFNFASATIGGAASISNDGIDLSGSNGVITFATVNINNIGNNGIVISNATNAVNINGGSIGATNDAGNYGVAVSAGSGNVDVAASITKGAGGGGVAFVFNHDSGAITFSGNLSASGATGVLVQESNGGTITFSGASKALNTGAGAAVTLTNNSGATIDFTNGNLDIDTTSGAGFSATGGGTVNVTGANNTIDTGTGTALNVANTNIGGSDLTFLRISSNGAANGIVLNTTGTAGGLTVTGDGTAANNGSGGVITASTGDGISLTSTTDVHLNQMNITNNLGDGIGGSTIDGMVLNRLNISGNGNSAATDESGINIVDLTGTASNGLHPTAITNSVISNNFEFEVQVTNHSGTLTNLQFLNNAVTANVSAGVTGNVFNFLGDGTSSMGLTVTGGSFTGNYNPASPPVDITGTGVHADTSGTQMTVNVAGATFTGNNAGINVSTGPGNSTVTFDIDNNTFIDQRSTAINIFNNGNAPFGRTINGTITDNDIGDGSDFSGSTVGRGIDLGNEGAVNMTVLVSGNTIQDIGTPGVPSTGSAGIGSNIGVIAGNTGGGTTNLTITNNIINDIQDNRAILIDETNGAAGTQPTIFVNITGNTIDNQVGGVIGGAAGDGSYIRLDQDNGTFKVTQKTPTAAADPVGPAADPGELDDANGFNDTGSVLISIGGTVLFNQGTPPLPTTNPLPLLAGDGGVDAASSSDTTPPTDNTPSADTPPAGTTPVDTGPAAGDAPPATPPATPVAADDGILTQSELDGIVDAAILRWSAAGLSAEQIDALEHMTFGVADMAGRSLGSFAPGVITLDSDAAGWGWYLDATPFDDAEFGNVFSATRAQTDPTQAPAGHFDVLTTVMHEMGHALGLGDHYEAGSRDDLMYGWLVTGERRLPGMGEADGAVAGSITDEEFLASPVSIGVLPAGKAVKIFYDATIDAQNNKVLTNPSMTGTVTYTGGPGGGINTDDTALPGAPLDATVTDLHGLTLSGTVWNDASGGINGDGIKQPIETIVSGVAVSLFADANNNDMPDSPGSPIATTLTDAGGNYSFTDLAPGNYIVRIDDTNFTGAGPLLTLQVSPVTTPDYPDPDDDVDSDDNGGPHTPGTHSFSKAITLAYGTEPGASDVNNTLDFGFLSNPPPSINNLGGDTATFTEGDTAVILDQTTAATVTDNQTHFNGGSLTATVGAALAEDQLTIVTDGTVTVSSGTVSVGGLAIGTVSGNNTSSLTVSFNTNDATPAAVSALVQHLAYFNSNTLNPNTTQRTIAVTVNDGLTGTDSENTFVNVVDVNDEPTLVATVESPIFTEPAGLGTQAAAVAPFSGTAVSTIESGQTITSLTFTVSGLLDGANEKIVVDGTPITLGADSASTTTNNTMSYTVTIVSGTATVVLTKPAGVAEANIAALVNGITYQNTNTDNPSDGDRIFTLTEIVDSGSNSTPVGADNTTALSIISTVNVNPVNDPSSITGDSSGTVQEAGGVNNNTPGDADDTGDLDSTDVDGPNDSWQPVLSATAATHGSYTLTSGGVWAYTVNDSDPAVDTLNGAATLADSFTVFTTDGASQVVNITINAQNDAATITGDASGSVTEAGGVANGTVNTPSDTGDLNAADVDNNADAWQPVLVAAATTHGSYTLTADGVWTYTVNENDGAVQALNVGGTLADSFTALTEDGTSQLVSITINGANDAATITGDDTGTVQEAGGVNNNTPGDADDTGDLDYTDPDNTHDSWQPVLSATAATHGSYTLTAGGVWAYTVNDSDPAVQALNGAATLADSFTVFTADGTSRVVNITINAQNDAATITGETTGDVTEAGGVANGTPGTQTDTGNLDYTDPDNTSDIWQPVAAGAATANGYGTYALDVAGVWTYTLDDNNAAVQTLNGAATLTDTFNALTADGTSQTVTVTIHAQNDAPVVNQAPSSVNYTENAGATAVANFPPFDSGALFISDIDSTQINSVTVAITGGFVLGDQLDVDVTGFGVTVNYDDVNGILTVDGALNTINYTHILDTLTFFSTSDNPGASRTITWTVTDVGSPNLTSAPVTTTIAVTQVNDAPVNTVPAGPLSTPEDTALAITGLSVSDVDIGTGNITVTLSVSHGTIHVRDDLGPGFLDSTDFSPGTNDTSSVTFSCDPAFVNATLAALNGVVYTPAPNYNGSDTLTMLSDDGGATGSGGAKTDSDPVAINVTAVNDAPAFANLGGAHPVFTENGSSVVLDSNVTISDIELNAAGNYGGAILTLQRNGGANSDDTFGATGTLNLTNTNGFGENVSFAGGPFAGTFVGTATNPGDGTFSITFNSNATAAMVASVMQQIVYADVSDNPPASVQVDWSFSDGNTGAQGSGGAGTANGSVTVDINQIDDKPALANVAPGAAYVIGSAGVILSSGLGIFDPDATAPSPLIGLASATVKIESGFFAGDELFVNLPTDGGGHFILDAGTPSEVVTTISVQSNVLGNLMLTSSGSPHDSVPSWQQVLDRVSYHSTAADPSNGGTDQTRTISWQVNDGALNSDTPNLDPNNLVNATILHFDVPPSLDLDASGAGTGFTTSYTENNPAVAIVDTDVSITDPDTTALDSATITLTNAKPGDVLSVAGTPPSGIASSIDTSVAGQIRLQLFNSATLADYQTALGQVRFSNSSDNPDVTDRDIAVQVAGNEASSNVAHATIHVVAVNDASVLNANGGSLAYTENQPASAIDPLLTIFDVDSATLTGASVSIIDSGGSLHPGQDVLGFVNQNGITGNYVAATGLLTLSGTASVANYQSALRSVSYFNSDEDPSNNVRTISYRVNDGGGVDNLSNVVTASVTVQRVNDAPVNAMPGGQSGNEDADLAISGISVSDIDAGPNGLPVRTTLSVLNGTLTVNSAGGASITNSGTAAVTLEGTVAQINSALAAGNLIYHGLQNFNGADTLTVTTNDLGNRGSGGAKTDTDSIAITVNPVNDAPVLAGVATDASVRPMGAPVILSPGALISDIDSTTLSSARVRVSAGTFAGDGDVLAVSAGGLSGTAITASYNAATETLTLTGVDTLAHYQQVLQHVTFALTEPNATNFNLNQTRTIEWQLDDGSGVNNLSPVQTTTIHITKGSQNDFNADGFSDIFWTTDSGPLAIWEMNGFQISFADYTRLGASAVGLPGPDWHVVDTGDTNADGKADILWRTDSGKLAVWQMDGNHIIGADYLKIGSTVVNTPGADWHALGVLDANGDGRQDILWRTDSGALAIWELDGNQITFADYLRIGSSQVGVPGADWHIVGDGDFDGDGKGDLLWRTDSGALAIWELDGSQIKAASFTKIGATNVGAPASDWHVVDVADFDGDGKSDILWRTGQPTPANGPQAGMEPGGGSIAIWEMDGFQIKAADYTRLGSTAVGAPGLDWHVLGADDNNGDGKADILWRTDSGALAEWQMDGTHIAAADYTRIGATAVGAPGPDWHIYEHRWDLV